MATPEIKADVKIIPAKRTATYDVVLNPGEAPTRTSRLRAAVNTKSITFGASSDIPKTLEAVDAIIALGQAVREELVAQGITE